MDWFVFLACFCRVLFFPYQHCTGSLTLPATLLTSQAVLADMFPCSQCCVLWMWPSVTEGTPPSSWQPVTYDLQGEHATTCLSLLLLCTCQSVVSSQLPLPLFYLWRDMGVMPKPSCKVQWRGTVVCRWQLYYFTYSYRLLFLLGKIKIPEKLMKQTKQQIVFHIDGRWSMSIWK